MAVGRARRAGRATVETLRYVLISSRFGVLPPVVQGVRLPARALALHAGSSKPEVAEINLLLRFPG
jgi:hypothetical protein